MRNVFPFKIFQKNSKLVNNPSALIFPKLVLLEKILALELLSEAIF